MRAGNAAGWIQNTAVMSEIGERFETFKEEIGKRCHPDAHKLRGLAVLESSCLPLDLRIDSAV